MTSGRETSSPTLCWQVPRSRSLSEGRGGVTLVLPRHVPLSVSDLCTRSVGTLSLTFPVDGGEEGGVDVEVRWVRELVVYPELQSGTGPVERDPVQEKDQSIPTHHSIKIFFG